MEPITFNIPYGTDYSKRYGMNAYYSGKHWSARKTDAEYWHLLVANELKKQRIPRRVFTEPVKITFYHCSKMDIDNHAVIEKFIVDALKGYLVTDDTRKYYSEKLSKFHEGKYISVVVEEVKTCLTKVT